MEFNFRSINVRPSIARMGAIPLALKLGLIGPEIHTTSRHFNGLLRQIENLGKEFISEERGVLTGV